MSQTQDAALLTRRIPLPGRYGIAAITIIIVATLLRLIRLDIYLLNVRESQIAFESWSLYTGHIPEIGHKLPSTGPLTLIWNSFVYFLFGATDATARIGNAILGIGVVAIPLAWRPWCTRNQTLAISLILAISPTMVFASRSAEPAMLGVFLAMLLFTLVIRILHSENAVSTAAIVAVGVIVASLYAVGNVGLSLLITMAIATVTVFILERQHRSDGLSAHPDTTIALLSQRRFAVLALSITGTALLLFSRLGSNASALEGIWLTPEKWGQALVSGVSTVPPLFFVWSLLLYEAAAVIVIFVGVWYRRTKTADTAMTPGGPVWWWLIGWSVASLLLHSLAAGRNSGMMAIAVLPTLLVAGILLGQLMDGLRNVSVRRSWIAIASVCLLTAYSLNATIGLAFVRGESAKEPLAIDTPSRELRAFIDQTYRLSRDLSVGQEDIVDPTGYYGLQIQTTPEYQWPFTWYYRDFPHYSVVPVGAFTNEADIAIAANNDVLDKLGFTTSTLTWVEKPGDPLTNLRSRSILGVITHPSRWIDGLNYVLKRDVEQYDNPRLLTVGYGVRAMNKMHAQFGPYNLFDGAQPGPGSGLGQLDVPTGIAVGDDGMIYVLNSANARIDRYTAQGEFVGIWNGQTEIPLQLAWNGFQGGTSLTVGPDGLLYVADTWNHAVIVVAPNGSVVRVLGSRGVLTDITDTGESDSDPGLFFGPRGIAVSSDSIYVTDTGNERVQVFSKDGTFQMAFGGYGTENGQFIEPTGIAIDSQGNIWVADSGNARLQVFDNGGDWLQTWEVPVWEDLVGSARLNMLAFNADDVLFYTTPDDGVWAFREGQFAQIGSTAGVSVGGIAFDQNGMLLVTDRQRASVIRMVPILPGGFHSPAATPIATPEI